MNFSVRGTVKDIEFVPSVRKKNQIIPELKENYIG